MVLLVNPDRKQRFIEAYSDSLAVAICQADKTKLMFGVENIAELVSIKLSAIEKHSEKFDIENPCIIDTCRSLGISPTRAAVIAFLTVGGVPLKEDVPMPAELQARIEHLCRGVDDPLLYLIILRDDFPGWKIDVTADRVDVERIRN